MQSKVSLSPRVVGFVEGVIVGVLGLFAYQQVVTAVQPPVRSAPQPATVVYQAPATVLSTGVGVSPGR